MPKIVFLQPKNLVRHSRHHTAYTGDGARVKEGEVPVIHKLEFFNGVARDVPEEIYQRFKDSGIANVVRPTFDDDGDDLL